MEEEGATSGLKGEEREIRRGREEVGVGLLVDVLAGVVLIAALLFAGDEVEATADVLLDDLLLSSTLSSSSSPLTDPSLPLPLLSSA